MNNLENGIRKEIEKIKSRAKTLQLENSEQNNKEVKENDVIDVGAIYSIVELQTFIDSLTNLFDYEPENLYTQATLDTLKSITKSRDSIDSYIFGATFENIGVSVQDDSDERVADSIVEGGI